MSSRYAVVFSAATALLACTAAFVVAEEFEREDGVIVLTDDNFDAALEKYPHILVEFYAPWCGHCKALAPEYAKAAAILEEEKSELVVAKLDATVHDKTAKKFQVQGYPTLKFFANGKPIDYNSERKGDAIVNWMKKKSGPPAEVVKSVEDFKTLKDAHDVVVVAFTKDDASEIGKTFLRAAATPADESVFYAIVHQSADNAQDIFKEGEVDDNSESVVLFKKFDEGRVALDSTKAADEAEIRTFIAKHSLPLVVEFNQETAGRIFGGEIKNHLIIFASHEDADGYASIKKNAAEVAAKHRGEIIFVTINVDEPDHARITEFFGMPKDAKSGMRIIHLADEMAKYKPDNDDVTVESMSKFVQDFRDGKLKQHLLSDEIPDDWNSKPVHVLVGKNFADVVNQKEKHVFVKFYAPWCGHCKALIPIWEELGEKYKDRDDVIIAKIDSTTNELEDIKIQGFPTLKMFLKETNEVVEYNGERTLDGFVKFIDSNGKDGAASLPDDEDDDEEGDVGEDDDEGVESDGKDEL